MRWCSVVGLVAMLGCGEDSVAVWRECDAAFAALQRPSTPMSVDAIGSVDVGETLPVLRITTPPSDPDGLANRALATACVLTEAEVSATSELPKWAEQAAAGEFSPQEGAVFDDASLSASARPSSTAAASLEVNRHLDPYLPDLEGGETPEGIGAETASRIADRILAQLVDRGILADVDAPLLDASQTRRVVCSGQECVSFVQSYLFRYAPEVGGIPLIGVSVGIDIHRDGEPLRIALRTSQVEVVGQTVAAIDEATARSRFLELAEAAFPDFELFLDTPGRVAYLTPFDGTSSAVEPVWYAAYVVRSPSGVVGRPQPTMLSLTDENAQLEPFSPPE